ncbi:NADH dehydrogenase, FAD-containing subunit [Glycomyces sambucus]|uniref:NADH dehydrogenase, FAD-containing subunit n=1 Tax=Glycomyces sambucus TaxID=380244 RepID=A0A1G9KT65_9ACTN|nr:FAD-dependent oxidoreductase [Glycomyces sambucus]SDL52799.1 NADH dehydrogenase, FAD-containing subunit [Glycomyces sambucus]
MQHRITVLGAGFAGTWAAGTLARRLHRDDVAITVVNAEADFVERFRLHQVAAGTDLRRRDLAAVFTRTGVRFRHAAVTAVDAAARTATLDDGAVLEHDTLLYALGSTVADHGIPGVREHAFHVAGRPAALRLRERLDRAHGAVLVVGGNLTGIEAVTEIAESHPGLRVALATTGELGGWLGPKARGHLLRAFDRLGIAVHEDTEITEVTAAGALAADGRAFDAATVVWAAGFAAHPIAAASGLDVNGAGQILVDRQMRSVSHPGVYAAGDAAFTLAEDGEPLPMSCASAGFTAMQATSAIMGDLTGAGIGRTSLAYYGNHISLGRKDAVFQALHLGSRTTSWSVRGRVAAGLKDLILKTAVHGVVHPTYGLPVRKRRIARERREAVAAANAAY